MPLKIKRKGFRVTIRFTVVGVFAVATILTAAIAIGLQFYFSRAMAVDAALSQYQHTTAAIGGYLGDIDDKAFQTIRILSKHPEFFRENRVHPGTFPLFAAMMANNSLYYGIYIGFGNGDFFEVVNLDSGPAARRGLKAEPQDRWVVMSVQGEGNARLRHIAYYDDAFQLRESRSEKSDYDPRIRPWFTNAREDRVFKTDPYLFHYLQEPGQSYSIRIPSADAVLTVDITLASLSGFLRTQARDQTTEVYLYQKGGELIASNQSRGGDAGLPDAAGLDLTEEQRAYLRGLGKIRVSNELDWPPIDFAVSGEPRGYTVDLMRIISKMIGIEVEFVNGYCWAELIDLFKKQKIDVLQPVFTTEANAAMGILSPPVLTLSYAAVTRKGEPAITDIRHLAGKTIAIPAGWSIIGVIRHHWPDIRILEVSSPKEAIQTVVKNKAYATLDASIILHYTADYYFIEGVMFHENVNFGASPLPEDLHFLISKNMPLLADILNAAIARISPAQIRQLKQKWFHPPGAAAGEERKTTVPYSALVSMAENTPALGTLTRTVINGKPMFVYIAGMGRDRGDRDFLAIVTPEKQLLAPSMRRVKISILITTACLLVFLPVIWLFATPIVRPIKRLALENDKIKYRRYKEVKLHDTAIVEIYNLSTSIVDMALTIKQHEESLKALLESFIQLIAQTIDDKSPYTAKHCARVPELAIMLAEAASRSRKKPFDTFDFHGEEDYREFRIAAWLHDCGKLTTPEHIVDKGAKLETIYNRIHEIRTRFEVLWRDAEIAYLNGVMEEPEQETALRGALEQKRNQLQADFEFIANANIGSESMTTAQLERLRQLAMITWQRHFDDRLGLSFVESLRYPAEKSGLPATETLLADKPQHLVERSHDMDDAKKFGIRMEIPLHLYNLGELYNLSVTRGTLTREDRFKIQEHIISTIKMLESLPFPEELARVPRYASTHHETLRGTGYPRKLSGTELSMPERIIAVADIFEALTASDRPYKKAKKLSESIHILYGMVEAGDIDRDVFELFLTSGVYLAYGQRFLEPEQMDSVPIEQYLRGS